MSPPTSDHPVLIIGAGISGLCLAQGLLKARIPFIIFERDPALNIRSQGYRIRINSNGIAALQKTIPPSLYSRLVASCALIDDKRPPQFLDALSAEKANRPLAPQPPQKTLEGSDSLSVDRNTLRSVLVRGMEEHIQLGKGFSSYEATPSGVIARFNNGSEVKGSLLVGADGAWSRVKKQILPAHVPLDTEGRCIYGKTIITAELVDKFNENAMSGMTVVQDREREVPRSLLVDAIRFKDNEFRAELPEDYVYWVLMSRKDQIDMDDSELLNLSGEEVSGLVRKLTSHWHPSFHALFALQDKTKTAMLRICSSAPDIPTWKNTGSVTLIGDAAHVISPTAGVGAVTALRDAATLTQILEDEGISPQSLAKYEALMREYASEAIARAPIFGKVLFGMRPFEELSQVKH